MLCYSPPSNHSLAILSLVKLREPSLSSRQLQQPDSNYLELFFQWNYACAWYCNILSTSRYHGIMWWHFRSSTGKCNHILTSPKSFNVNIVQSPTFAIHTNLNLSLLKILNPVITCKLRSLI